MKVHELISIVLDLKQFAVYRKYLLFRRLQNNHIFVLKILKFLDFSHSLHITLMKTKIP